MEEINKGKVHFYNLKKVQLLWGSCKISIRDVLCTRETLTRNSYLAGTSIHLRVHTMRKWHLKSHWKSNHTETPLKSHWKASQKINHTEISSLTTLKYIHLLLFKKVFSPNNPTKVIVTHIPCSLYFQRYSVFVSVIFSVIFT